jgi:putative transcriptional regulator
MLPPPSPQKIKTLRVSLGLTQQEAADSVHVTLRAWQMWESGQRKMSAAAWELCVIKAGIHPLYAAIQKFNQGQL